jgi:lysyl endopeptidase
MNKIIILFLCCLVFDATDLTAQMTNEGQPKSWGVKSGINTIDYYLMPAFDAEKQKKIDAINDGTGTKPWQFGFEHTVYYNLQNSGTWTTLPNGDRIWQIEFESRDAITMNLIFDDYNLPLGATVYLYNPKTKEYQGAYTSNNNSPGRMLGTTLIHGDDLVVEYYEPKSQAGNGQLNISMVVHGYRALGEHPLSKKMKGLNDAGNCNHDVLCPLGIGWEDQTNSVAIIIVGGSGSCTGTLINNTTNDGTPYFLSANHCGTTGLGAWVFRFNWDSPVAACASTVSSVDPGGPYNEVNGAILRANNGGTDFSLMELNAAPTGNVYYAGWDRSITPATEATGIHHPRGDVKKICRENNTLVASTMSGADVWQVTVWDQGVTEPGSSGSALFNQNKLIVGQLYGGGAACSGLTTNGQEDNYGRLDISWSGTSAATRLSDWLDPAGTGAMSHQGYNPNGPGFPVDAGIALIEGIEDNYCNIDSFMPEVTIRNYGADTITTVDVLYNIDGGSNATYTWNGALAPNDLSIVVLPTVTATTGAHTFNVSTTFPNGSLDSNAVNDARSFSFFITLGGQQVDYSLATDCYGDEITWSLSDSSTGMVLFTGGGYSNSTSLDTFSREMCLADGCYRFTIYDSYGDGLDGTPYATCGRSGDYWIQDPLGNTLVEMTAVDGDFGDSAVHYFCLPFVITNQTALDNIGDQFKVFPNPTNGNVYIDLTLVEEQNIQLELYNATGQMINSIQRNGITNERFQFELNNYSPGMYFVKLRMGAKIYARKIVKQ